MKSTAGRVRWSAKDYFRMADAGLFKHRRVELIQGEVVSVPAQATPHRAAVTKISKLLLNAFDDRNWVVIQGTLLLKPDGAPDPDFHVFAVPIGTPDSQLPPPLLVIEVSDSTYLRDSGPKLRMHARANIDDYWIVNLNTGRVEVYRRPENLSGRRSGWRYSEATEVGSGQQVHPLHRPDLSFPVDLMFP